MSNAILVINAGSATLKFSVYDAERLSLWYHGEIDRLTSTGKQALQITVWANSQELILKETLTDREDEFGLHFLTHWLAGLKNKFSLKAIGHRIVHGGAIYFKPVLVSDNILRSLDQFIPLAPLHQAHNLDAVRVMAKLHPNLPQVACFDTAFHQTQNPLATLFALPKQLMEEGIQRYGFHGLSYEYIASVLPQYLDIERYKRVIVAHLGQGASVCGMIDRESKATSMGFTALDGLMMGSRCGNLDPGVILYLMEAKKMSLATITHLLYHQSGLLGVSGISSDMRDLLAQNAPQAQEAIDLFCYRAAREMGALLPILGGCDAIVFTAGIGENAPLIREKIVSWLAWMGIKLNAQANQTNQFTVSETDSAIWVGVIPTNEALMIAKHVKVCWIH